MVLILENHCVQYCTFYWVTVKIKFLFVSLSFLSWRFGDGYTIILRLADTKSKSTPESCPVSSYMKNCFPSIELKERHQNVQQYQLPSHACCLAHVFDVLANNYEELGITDFSVSQTTLDQVRSLTKVFTVFQTVLVFNRWTHSRSV